MGIARLFENFDIDPVIPEVCEKDLPGYAAGYSAGLTEAANQRDVMTAEAAQAIADLTFTYAEACQLAQKSLKPLLAVLVDHLLPVSAPATLRQDILHHLQSAADTILDYPIVLHLNPDAIEPLTSVMSETLAKRIKLTPDDSLTPLMAQLRTAEGETLFDRQSLIAAITDLVNGQDWTETKGSKNG